jgi:hypothetical protein
MAQRGKPSIAHEYDERGACIHCGMYKVNVERMSHVCKQWRELTVDMREASKQNVTLEEYRRPQNGK